MLMRSLFLALFVLIGAAAVAAGQSSAPQPQPAGALQPQQTSPLQGATPQTPGAPTPPPATVVAPPLPGRIFAAEQGVIFNTIKPDKVADFETVIAKLRKALETSKDPIRNQQGWGWKIFKAAEPGPNGSVLYVFVMDPAVKGADYGIAKILAEAYPTEIMELYRMYIGAFAPTGQTLLNLQPVAAPADPGGAVATPPPATGAPAPPSAATAPR
jgi:hypothetical protein